MENQKLIETLKEALFNDKWSIITNLISDLQQEILASDVKGVSSKQRISKTMAYHRQMLKSMKRPILSFTSDDALEGYQSFTDSYFLVALKGNDLLTIPDYKKANELYRNDSKLNPQGLDLSGKYPDLTRIFPQYIDKEKKIKVNIGDLLKACKAYKTLHFKNKDVDFYLDNELLERYILFMNYQNKDIVELYHSGGFRPVISYHDESKGLILPFRCENENETTVYQVKEEN